MLKKFVLKVLGVKEESEPKVIYIETSGVSLHAICNHCGILVARWEPTEKGPLCANCRVDI